MDKINIYRGLEKGDKRKNINQGDFVTLDKSNAVYYAGEGGLVLTKLVNVDDLTPADWGHFFYNPLKDTFLINWNKQFPEHVRTKPLSSQNNIIKEITIKIINELKLLNGH